VVAIRSPRAVPRGSDATRVQVGLHQTGRPRLRRAAGVDADGRPDRRDGRLDLGVDGRDDLRSAGQVDLQAVVVGRVV
jgi:hypothetical protein